MADILLIDTNTTPFNEAFPVYPIGLDYLQGAVEEAGLGRAEILDLTRAGGPLDTPGMEQRHARSLQLLERRLKGRDWDVVGLSLRNIDSTYPIGQGQETLHHYLPQLREYCDCVEAATGPATRVILGGTGFSIMPRAFLEGRPDNWHGVVGPGETALVDILQGLASGQEPPRLVRGKQEKIGSLQNLDLLFRYLELPDGEGVFGLRTKTGCGQACGYCPYPVINGPRQTLKPPKEVVRELALLARVHAEHPHGRGLRFMFADDIFNRPLEHAKQVLAAMLEAGIKPASWHAYLDPGQVDDEFLELIGQSNGWRSPQGPPVMFFPLDIESGSDKMLGLLRKPFRRDAVLQTASAFRRAGREWVAAGRLQKAMLGLHLLVGYPGEDESTIAETCDLINRIQPEQIAVQIGVRVYPGTHLAGLVRGSLWNQEADLYDPVFVEADEERILGWMRSHLNPAYNRLARRGKMLMIGREED